MATSRKMKKASLMQDFLTRIEKIKTPHLYLILTALAALLAARIQYIQHGWINPDTVLYFESARLIALGQFKEAVTVFNWPMYSLCIATVHKLTTLNIHHSAQLLSVIFFAITTASFVKIIELGGGNKKTMMAGALILFSASYVVGDVLEMLMRDQGFWACFLTSLVFFIRFKSNHQYRNAFLWQAFAMLATLFRIEAIMYLLFLPLVLLFEANLPFINRAKNFIKCNFLNILVAAAIIFALSLNSALSMQSFGRLQEVFTNKLFQELTYNLVTKGQVMGEQVLGKYLQEYAISGLILTFIFAIVVKTILATGIVNFGLAAYSTRQKKLIKEPVHSTLKAAAIIALITMSLIITKVFVLSGRYVVGLAFILMIAAAFQLGKMLTEYSKGKVKDKKLTLVLCLIFIFMLGCTIKNIWPKAKGYNYMQDAVAWLKKNNHENAPVFYNESRLRFYANERFLGTWSDNHKYLEDEIKKESFKKYQWILVKSSRKHPDHEVLETSFPKYQLVMRFSSIKRDKEILIYKKEIMHSTVSSDLGF